jgi:hypothetical protein
MGPGEEEPRWRDDSGTRREFVKGSWKGVAWTCPYTSVTLGLGAWSSLASHSPRRLSYSPSLSLLALTVSPARFLSSLSRYVHYVLYPIYPVLTCFRFLYLSPTLSNRHVTLGLTSRIMSPSYYERRVHYWLEDFDHPIRIAEPAPTSIAPRAPSDLDRHLDERLQLKDVKFHPHLLDIMLSQLDDAMPTIPEGSRINERDRAFYQEPRSNYRCDNEAQVQAKGLSLLKAASQLASIISFLLAEESYVPLYPLDPSPSASPGNIPDHEVTFFSDYGEQRYFESRPLHPDTIDRIKRFAAVTSYLK